MLLIDEGELGSGLQQETLEDIEAAIHPRSHLHTPKLLLHTWQCKLEFEFYAGAFMLNQCPAPSQYLLKCIAVVFAVVFFKRKICIIIQCIISAVCYNI